MMARRFDGGAILLDTFMMLDAAIIYAADAMLSPIFALPARGRWKRRVAGSAPTTRGAAMRARVRSECCAYA